MSDGRRLDRLGHRRSDMKTVMELLVDHPFFAGTDEHLVRRLARSARSEHFHTGDLLFEEDHDADRLIVVRSGRVALSVPVAGRGLQVVSTVGAGEIVGWSWFVPPYRWLFDARAVTEVSAVSIDAAGLRDRCAEDPALGYALMSRVAEVMYQRLHCLRLRAPDVYAVDHGG
jgi:CRP/FNR family cyclic AMP-dependent transcriptional regulator